MTRALQYAQDLTKKQDNLNLKKNILENIFCFFNHCIALWIHVIGFVATCKYSVTRENELFFKKAKKICKCIFADGQPSRQNLTNSSLRPG